MSAKDITFPSPVTTTGLAGFPDALHGVAEARRVVEAMRLPVVRSRHAWLDVANLLMLAQASQSPAHILVARNALDRAVVAERHDRRAVPSDAIWAIAT